MAIKKGDNVIVIAGKDRGRQGKVVRSLPTEDRLVVEGVNVRKRRTKARKSGQKGQTIEVASPVNVSNVLLYCSSCGKGVRVAAKLEKGRKVRVCAKCGKEL